eukprot:3755054-Amphidinium_carterae.1
MLPALAGRAGRGSLACSEKLPIPGIVLLGHFKFCDDNGIQSSCIGTSLDVWLSAIELWRLCVLLPVTCVHEVIGGVHEFFVLSIGTWCWCYTDARFHVDESGLEDMSLPRVLRAILERVDMVCKTEQSRRMENLSVGPHSPYEVYAAWEDVVVDVERWRPLLDEAEQVFTVKRSFPLFKL